MQPVLCKARPYPSRTGTPHSRALARKPRRRSRRYPGLRGFLLRELEAGASSLLGDQAQSSVSPSLHPLLTLLSRLKPGTRGLDSRAPVAEEYKPVIEALLGARHYHIRVLGARAFVPLVCHEDLASTLAATLAALGRASTSPNSIHGRLVLLRVLLETNVPVAAHSAGGSAAAIHELDTEPLLALVRTGCPLLAAEALKVLRLLIAQGFPLVEPAAEAAAVRLRMESHGQAGPSGQGTDGQMGGRSLVFSEAAGLLAAAAAKGRAPAGFDDLALVASAASYDARLVFLRQLPSNHPVVAGLLQGLAEDQVHECLEAGLAIAVDSPDACARLAPFLRRQLQMMAGGDRGGDLAIAGRALHCMAILLGSGAGGGAFAAEDYSLLLACLERAADPENQEDLRLMAARALDSGVLRLLLDPESRSHRDVSLAAVGLRACDVALTLLEDEDIDVRWAACTSVARALGPAVQQDACVERLLRLLVPAMISSADSASRRPGGSLVLKATEAVLRRRFLPASVRNNLSGSSGAGARRLFEKESANLHHEPVLFMQARLRRVHSQNQLRVRKLLLLSVVDSISCPRSCSPRPFGQPPPFDRLQTSCWHRWVPGSPQAPGKSAAGTAIRPPWLPTWPAGAWNR